MFGIKSIKQIRAEREQEARRREQVRLAFKFIDSLPEDHMDWEMLEEDDIIPFYAVSKDGRVQMIANGRYDTHIVHQATNNCGYKIVKLRKTDGTFTTKTVQRLVADVWIEKPKTSEKLEVDHIDGDRRNNRVENLQWLTVSQNRKKRHNLGRKRVCGMSTKDRKVHFYNSIEEASRATGVSNSNIKGMASGLIDSSSTNYIFCFLLILKIKTTPL